MRGKSQSRHSSAKAGNIENAIKADIDRHAIRAMKDKEKFINNVLLSMNESSAERSEKKFTMMSAHYEQEQDANEEKLSELERQHKEKSAVVL